MGFFRTNFHVLRLKFYGLPVRLLFLLGLLSLVTGVGLAAATGTLISKPSVVHIGAMLTFNSTIGKAANLAIDMAVEDVNSDPNILKDTKIVLSKLDTNYSGFLGIVEALKFMEREVVGIVGPQSSQIAHVISHVANELHVPLLSYSATDPLLSSLQYPFFVRTTQNDLFQMAAMADLVDFYGWKQVTVIFVDDDYGRNGISALGDELASRRCRISFKVALPPGPDVTRNDIIDVLVEVALMESRVIVLHANPDSGMLVLSVAHHLDMMGTGYVWITTDMLSIVLDSMSPLPAPVMDSMQGLLLLRQHTADSEKKKIFISRWNKLAKDAGLGGFRINHYGLYAYDTVWILAHAIDRYLNDGGVISFSNDSRLMNLNSGNVHIDALSIFDGGRQLLRDIRQTRFVGLTGRVQFDQDKNLMYPAYDVVNVVGTGSRRVGYWSNYSGLSVVPPETLYLRPPNRSIANEHLLDVIWPGGTSAVPRGWVFPNNGRRLKIAVPRRVSFKEFVSEDKSSKVAKGFCIDVFVAAVNLLPYAVPYQFVPFGNGNVNPAYSELARLISLNVQLFNCLLCS